MPVPIILVIFTDYFITIRHITNTLNNAKHVLICLQDERYEIDGNYIEKRPKNNTRSEVLSSGGGTYRTKKGKKHFAFVKPVLLWPPPILNLIRWLRCVDEQEQRRLLFLHNFHHRIVPHAKVRKTRPAVQQTRGRQGKWNEDSQSPE